jgi:hypothetical protein
MTVTFPRPECDVDSPHRMGRATVGGRVPAPPSGRRRPIAPEPAPVSPRRTPGEPGGAGRPRRTRSRRCRPRGRVQRGLAEPGGHPGDGRHLGEGSGQPTGVDDRLVLHHRRCARSSPSRRDTGTGRPRRSCRRSTGPADGLRVHSPADVRDALPAAQLRLGGHLLEQIAPLIAQVRSAGGVAPLESVPGDWRDRLSTRSRAVLGDAAALDASLGSRPVPPGGRTERLHHRPANPGGIRVDRRSHLPM